MDALKIEGISQNEKNDMTDYLALIINQVMPDFKKFIKQKKQYLNNGIIFTVITVILFVIEYLVAVHYKYPYSQQRYYSKTPSFMLFSIIELITIGISCGLYIKYRALSFTNDLIKIGKVPARFGKYPFEGESAMVDHDGLIKSAIIDYPNLKDPNRVQELAKEYQDIMKKLPLVMPVLNEHSNNADESIRVNSSRIFDTETRLQDIYRNICQCYEDTVSEQVELGIMESSSAVLNCLTKSDMN
jgi:hypothetical protein